ncbi:methylated-DNA--[protein]-cysteine S-methyltransferase [Candidatus Deianiraea vastatrix]|uniref:Methylated-DNA--protein-cysteine methyltransferase n=1 Tax=Candidatus Deianiraea vastatrix TaxID=2163644 RepID=A0A5B8XEC5_9RICK|nr:MGMT family protein [Candidatus Deianiraea vastatrix]QED23235.1 Methylated-DNA--protein-cysteine methyltransferase [Candidatus Deianiraea vastatrix]
MNYKDILNDFFDKRVLNCGELIKLVNLAEVTEKHKIVLRNLLDINKGEVVSYSDFAKKCGFDIQTRNIASLIGKNPFPVIIPCHRVIRKSGEIGNFIFGSGIKKELLDFDSGKITDISTGTKNTIYNFYS